MAKNAQPESQMRLPSLTEHMAIIGRTGTGKTQAGCWHLSRAAFDVQPFLIVDFKGDEILNGITRARDVSFDWRPAAPGLYMVHPTPMDVRDGALDDLLWTIYATGECGLYVDEGYMMGDSAAFETLLTQGRSKRIPIITLTQRPVWLSRFVFSEASYYQLFALNDRRDQRTVESFVPVDMRARLPAYHSYYYDVADDRLIVLAPVPSQAKILARIDDRLERLQSTKKSRRFL